MSSLMYHDRPDHRVTGGKHRPRGLRQLNHSEHDSMPTYSENSENKRRTQSPGVFPRLPWRMETIRQSHRDHDHAKLPADLVRSGNRASPTTLLHGPPTHFGGVFYVFLGELLGSQDVSFPRVQAFQVFGERKTTWAVDVSCALR